MRRPRILLLALAMTVAAGLSLSGQPALRRVTNVAALLAYPGFYHLRPVIVAGELALGGDGRFHLTTDEGTVPVIVRGGAPEGPSEVRGELWDVGRMNPDDPRLAVYDLGATFRFDPEGPWPRPGQVTALVASAVAPASSPRAPSVRAIVLDPARYLDQTVTVTGQFSGRNLLGDLPDGPANSPFDFVLRSAEGAIWVSWLRPRGADFDLALDARMDTNRWLEVTGVVQRARGLQWIDGRDGRVTLTTPQSEATAAGEPVPVPAGPRPEVLFSVPAPDEIDVDTGTRVRVQFSRNIDADTFSRRVRASYVEGNGARPGRDIALTVDYAAAGRVLQVTFVERLETFRTVQLDLLEGILGVDEQPLEPWSLRFSTGGG